MAPVRENAMPPTRVQKRFCRRCCQTGWMTWLLDLADQLDSFHQVFGRGAPRPGRAPALPLSPLVLLALCYNSPPPPHDTRATRALALRWRGRQGTRVEGEEELHARLMLVPGLLGLLAFLRLLVLKHVHHPPWWRAGQGTRVRGRRHGEEKRRGNDQRAGI